MVQRGIFVINVKELHIQDSSERVERNIVFRGIGLGKRIMEGGQVGTRRDTGAVKRIMFVDNRDLILFNHGNKMIVNVEDKLKERKVSRGAH
jgi:hypothetical protein